ncbi:hypothetical protein JTE90_002251 [Oedothorax gibbosus]|uniref:Uncharacterized protein n=1 Tax=Oedothorax gibbosus TaxID=931172 RepID=A0AAV6V8Q3_9ARAC|nr:hypothetical protein JTE90_002251 [Oedothorax gibbosus]
MALFEVLFVFLLVWIQSSESVTSNSEAFGNSQSSKPSITPSSKITLPRVPQNDDYEPSGSISSPFLMPFSSVPMNFHPQWLNDGNKPDGNWFGINRFVTRTARNMVQNQRLRDAQLLGEGTYLYPTTFYPGPSFYYEHAHPFPLPMNDLQVQSSVPHQDHFADPRVEQFIRFPKGPQQYQNFYNQNHQNLNNQNQQNFNYQRSNSNLQRSSASPTPVTIKIIPLKLSAMDISNALKSMSWIPIPFDMLKGNKNNNNNNQNNDNNQPVYSDKRQSVFDDDEEEDESDLPPPSSHVATPPVGITYAEGRKSERFVRRFAPPK